MPNDYSIHDLAKLTDVTPRTIRYYIEQGLLHAPAQVGSKSRYTDEHLERLRLIKKLQTAHLPLAEIRAYFRGTANENVTSLAEDMEPAGAHLADSAIDYINRLLRPSAPPPAQPPLSYARLMPAAEPEPPQPPEPLPDRVAEPFRPAEPDRAQWERIALDPDIEIHIRRPLTRQQTKRVERLISIARQLLEE